MKTVITRVRVQPGQEAEWDETLRRRVAAAREQPGFVSAHVCAPVDAPEERLVIGTWRSEEDWRRWHEQREFAETREPLGEADEDGGTPAWHEVIVDEHR